MKSGDQWVFSFSIPVTSDNGRRTPQLFEQRVRWSPEIKTYLFEHLSDSDYKRMKTDFIVTRYSNRGWITLSMKKRSETETMVIDQFTWDRQR